MLDNGTLGGSNLTFAASHTMGGPSDCATCGNSSTMDGLVLNVSASTELGGSTLADEGHAKIDIEPYSFAHLVVTSIILGTIILATIIGNVFVIAAVTLERNLHVNVANFLITSLAVADLMVAALVMPLAAVNEVSKKWFLASEMCDMWISFDVICCTSSILHLVAISIDRYWAVTQVDYIRNRSAKRILLMIAASWIISVIISIPPLFGWKDPAVNNPSKTGSCLISQDWGYTVFSTLGAFYIPLIAMVIIYIKIFQVARTRIRKKNFRNGGKAKHGPTQRPLLHSTTESTVTVPTPNGCGHNQSPEASSNGSAIGLHLQDDANRNNKHITALTPPASPQLKEPNNKKGSFLDISKLYLEGKLKGNSPKKKDREKENLKEKLEQKRERKAARTLGIITGCFVVCWLPFFIMEVVRPFCGDSCHYPPVLMSVIGWLGYLNSLLNPIIYTIFSPDFRMAFRKILFGKYHGRGGRSPRR